MTFLNPAMFWWLALLAPLAALYLLKVRPTREPTSTYFLWEQVLRQKKSSALLHRLRDVLSLLLVALALASVVTAMARPRFQTGADARDLVLLIDNSPSMSARDGGATRLDLARRNAREILQAMDAGRRAVLATTAGGLEYVVHLSDNRRELLDGLDAIAPSDLPTRLGDLRAVLDRDDLRERFRVILISDGCFEADGDVDGVELLQVAAPADNIGIIGFDLLRLPGEGERAGLYFQLASSASGAVSIDVVLSHETPENVVAVCPVVVRPGVNEPELFDVAGAPAGRYMLHIDRPDALETDNTAFAVIPEHRPIRLAVAQGSGAFFLARCVEAFGRSGGPMQLVDESQAEVILASGEAVSPVGPTHHVVFHPSGESPFWESLGDVAGTGVARLAVRGHPAVRFSDIESLAFHGARRIVPPGGSLVIATDTRGMPLIYRAQLQEQTAYIINLDPEDSELFLSAQFPLLVWTMVRDLVGRGDDAPAAVAPGTVLPLAAGDQAEAFVLTDPSGARIEARSTHLPALRRRGFWQLETRGEARWLAVGTSDVADVLLGEPRIAPTQADIPRGRTSEYWLVLLAVGFLTAETVMYHRRKAG